MNNESARAKHLLVHYMRALAFGAGVHWDGDNDVEVEEIVDAIIEAAVQEAVKRTLRALPPSVQE